MLVLLSTFRYNRAQRNSKVSSVNTEDGLTEEQGIAIVRSNFQMALVFHNFSM